MTIGPIEESFAMMNRYGLVYSSSDSERVDGLTYAWRKLHAQVGESEVLAELLARAKRARSGAPWVRKFGKLSSPENLVMT